MFFFQPGTRNEEASGNWATTGKTETNRKREGGTTYQSFGTERGSNCFVNDFYSLRGVSSMIFFRWAFSHNPDVT